MLHYLVAITVRKGILMRKIGYARTTINDCDLTAQIAALEAFGCDEVVEETNTSISEKKTSQLDQIVQEMKAGDALIVTQLNRLGRSTRQLTQLTEILQAQELHLVALKEEIDTRRPMGEIYFNLMQGLASMECDLIKERTLVGLNEARKKGKVGGRPKIDQKTVKKIRRLYYDKNETIQLISSKCRVSVGTCYKYINLSEEELAKIL